MDETCIICYQRVRVPVRFICFPCKHTHGRPTCNSMIRVCLMCAREYLQLTKYRYERDNQRKCLTCPAKTVLYRLNATNAYEKDFLMMRNDSCADYSCFNSEKGCNFHGTQNQLDNHNQNDCEYRIVLCLHCRLTYQFNEKEEHYLICEGKKTCDHCEKRIVKSDYLYHLKNDHNMTTCYYCDLSILVSELSHHLENCLDRPYRCDECRRIMVYRLKDTHLKQHLHEWANQIINLRLKIQHVNSLI